MKRLSELNPGDCFKLLLESCHVYIVIDYVCGQEIEICGRYGVYMFSKDDTVHVVTERELIEYEAARI